MAKLAEVVGGMAIGAAMWTAGGILLIAVAAGVLISVMGAIVLNDTLIYVCTMYVDVRPSAYGDEHR